MGLILALDFDGTLVEEAPPPLRWRPLAKEGIQSLKRAGHFLVLFSGRLTPRYEACATPAARAEADEFWRTGTLPPDVEEQWRRCAEMREFLVRERVWELFDAVWQNPGKPPCDKFLDNKAEYPNWVEIAAFLGVPLLQ